MFESSVHGAGLLTLADTADCGPMIEAYRGARLSPDVMWGLASMYRYFSKWATWLALLEAGAVPGPQQPRGSPNFFLVEEVLGRLSSGGAALSRPQPVDCNTPAHTLFWPHRLPCPPVQPRFGGGRRPAVLRAVQLPDGNWVDVGRRASCERDARAAECLWNLRPVASLFPRSSTLALPSSPQVPSDLDGAPCTPRARTAKVAAIRNLFKQPSAAAFAHVLLSHTGALERKTRGLAGPYTLKCLLDTWLPVVKLPAHVYGPDFPIDCPNYRAAARVLFPRLPSTTVALRPALFWLYRRLGPGQLTSHLRGTASW